MTYLFTNIYPQETAMWEPPVLPVDYQGLKLTRNDSEFTSAQNMHETQILRTVVSSTGVWPSEQIHEYLELGEALSEMVKLEEDDEWRIDKPVYATACYIAAGLKVAPYPAPRIFNHGPKSVVFNWSVGTKNLYLTISSNRISAMVSSPERIERRIDHSLNQLTNPALFLSSIQPSNLGQSFDSIKVVSDPSELYDWRIDHSLNQLTNPAFFLSSIQHSNLGQSFDSIKGVSNPPELFD
jgi:hypothetical protein